MNTQDLEGYQKLLKVTYSLLSNDLFMDGSIDDEDIKQTLSDLQRNMVLLLTGHLPERITYLASLDPGIGKTQSLCAILKAWKHLQFQPAGSVLVALSTHDEIRACIDRADLQEDDFAIVVARDEPLGTLGRVDRDSAPVLFTTHEQIYRAAGRGRFEDQSLFHFMGAPRSLRVWDETMLPAKPLTLRLDDIAGLLSDLRPIAPSAAERVEELHRTLAESEQGAIVTVPADIAGGVQALSALQGAMADRWHLLCALAGRQAVVTRCNSRGVQLVSARDRIPADFAPVLVMDASGRARHTYRLQEEMQGNLVRLPAATRSYRNLTVHHWDRGASRSTFEDRRSSDERTRVLDAVASTINASPADEEWLIVYHKPRSAQLDTAAALRSMVSNPDRVKFLNWGRHHGTNAFREVRNVIILGLWHYSEAVYTGLAIAASGDAGALGELRDIEAGEHSHNLLQAICRASVRAGRGSECGHCTAYVIGKAGQDTKALLAETFPGCVVHDWQPVVPKLRGAAQRVTEELERRFAAPGVRMVPKGELRDAVDLSSSQALAKVLRSDAVRHWMVANDIAQDRHTVIRAA